MRKNSKLIRVRLSTAERIQRHGRMGDTYDEVVNRMLDLIEREHSAGGVKNGD